MFLGGLWHGASWNFVLWGTFHGIALAVHKMWMSIIGRKKGEQSHGWRRVFGVIITFHFVCFCWIFFRNADFQNSMDMLRQIFTTFRPQLFPQLLEGYWKVFALMLLGFLLHFAPDSWENAVCRGVIRLPFRRKSSVDGSSDLPGHSDEEFGDSAVYLFPVLIRLLFNIRLKP